MTSLKDLSSSRPLPQSIPTTRQSNGRPHSHSVSLSALSFNHRVTRRKSMTSTPANSVTAAATAAVINEAAGTRIDSPINPSHHRRGLSLRRAAGLESTSIGSPSAFGSYIARNGIGPDRKPSPSHGNAADELVDGKPISIKNRSRRASEGSHLIKGEGKRALVELKCDRCGKGYKHSSCLTKHMWEHDPAWAVTSKLLISKHQQVQLLEAASVLVNMNIDPSVIPSDIAIATGDSDRSSASPTAASGISELRDDTSSTETTPPPLGDDGTSAYLSRSSEAYRFGIQHAHNHHHIQDNSPSAFSRSFQSIPSSSFASSMPSYSPARSHFRQSSTDTRPSTADTGVLDDDEAGLAAAIELCHFGTPRSRPSTISTDVPPVPPLPPQYLSQSSNPNTSTSIGASGSSFGAYSPSGTLRAETASIPTIFDSLSINAPLSYRVSDERDVKMSDMNSKRDIDLKSRGQNTKETDNKDDSDQASDILMDDDDDGVFGRMEE
ncbi:hypothetical protein FQN57_007317 [Myotisia sp. PD_48]|nr:hypothetical protein FQN57_007317 [Myotisia sp. PD_48]